MLLRVLYDTSGANGNLWLPFKGQQFSGASGTLKIRRDAPVEAGDVGMVWDGAAVAYAQ